MRGLGYIFMLIYHANRRLTLCTAAFRPYLRYASNVSKRSRYDGPPFSHRSKADRGTHKKLCLRQNAISHINFPENFGARLQELDLYDNLISHIKGLEAFRELTSLDLSFNNIKHIKNVNHLKKLTDIYFVQNKITKIEGLDGLDKLRNLELAANRIRVSPVPLTPTHTGKGH